MSLKSEIEEGFIAQKTCDGKSYLHSGTAKTAVSPVGLTDLWSASDFRIRVCWRGVQV